MRRLLRAFAINRQTHRRAATRLAASWQQPRRAWTQTSVLAGYEAPLLLLVSGMVATTIVRSSAQRRPSEPGPSAAEHGDDSTEGTAPSSEVAMSLHDVYEVGATLGHGHFATVYRGVHRESGEQVAVKAIAKSRTDVSAIRREVAILQKVGSHRNVVALRDVFETEDEWYLVMELVTGGELFERLVKQGPYSEKEASRLMQQIGEGVDWLHSQGVCHRDLKPENLLLSEPNDAGDITVKICDFGLSVALGQEGTLDEKQVVRRGG